MTVQSLRGAGSAAGTERGLNAVGSTSEAFTRVRNALLVGASLGERSQSSAGLTSGRGGDDAAVVGRVGIGGGEVLRLIEQDVRADAVVRLLRESDSPRVLDRDLRSQVRRAALKRDERRSERTEREQSDQRTQRQREADERQAPLPAGNEASATRVDKTPSGTDGQRSVARVLIASENAAAATLSVELTRVEQDRSEAVRERTDAAGFETATRALASGPYEPERLVELLG